jgi:hypothetical protein
MLMGLVLGVGCIFSPDEEPPPPEVPPEIVPRTSPENVLKNLQAIYNDKVRSATERRQFYEQLLPPEGTPVEDAFTFHFQAVDIGGEIPPSWPKDAEIAAHDALFRAQESGDVYSLELRITHDDPEPVNQIGREDWLEIFASNVYLLLMYNIQDGLEVSGGQAKFLFAPPVDSLYVINDWTDLPRP